MGAAVAWGVVWTDGLELKSNEAGVDFFVTRLVVRLLVGFSARLLAGLSPWAVAAAFRRFGGFCWVSPPGAPSASALRFFWGAGFSALTTAAVPTGDGERLGRAS